MVFKLIQPATISFIVLFFIPAPGVCATTGQSNVNDAIIFNRSILSVIDGYYDPGRINPKAMLDAVVNSLQKTVAELKITHDDKKKTYRIEINDTPLIINYNAISSPWEISRLLTTIIKFVNKNINDIDYEPEDIEYAATNAMLATLDPHTNALKPEIFEELMFSTMGEFGGLGIKITTDIRPPCNGYLTIVEVFDDTPASKAGLKIGDRVIKINQESTLNITTSEAAKRMRGKPGSSVKITINRRKNKTITLDIVRGAIPIESVSHKLLDGSVGYVEILGFQESTAKELQAVLKTFNKKKIAGLILDLRGNPGGLLDAATNIADMFIKSGTIVTIAGRRHDEKEIVNAKDNGNEPLYPIVVLIDNYSASAAEILAGALKNHSRAILIGHTTFGKGSVQRIERLPDGGGIKMTRSQYLLPGGDSIQATGVLPHIKFIRTFVDPEMMNIDPSKKRFSEADLESHLTGDSSISHGDFPKINKSAIFIPQKEMKKDKKKFKRCYLSDSNYKPFVSRFELEFARELIEFHKGK